MRFGAPLPWAGPIATPDNVSLVSTAAERLGYDYVFMGGHLFWPKQARSPYPYTTDGVSQADPTHANLDIFVLLSYIAGQTTDLGLKTAILVLPWQSPVLTAKHAATLDVLCKGKLTLGLGVGWMREEFAAVGVPFEQRGAIAEEYIEALRALWTQSPASFKGEYCQFDEVYAEPRPVQRPLPIWLVGSNTRTINRVARLGDGWEVPAPVDIGSPEYDRLYRQLRAALLERDRGVAGFDVCTTIHVHFGEDLSGGYVRTEYFGRKFPPDADVILEALAAWKAAGVTAVELHPGSRYDIPPELFVERIAWFAEEVLPRARAL